MPCSSLNSDLPLFPFSTLSTLTILRFCGEMLIWESKSQRNWVLTSLSSLSISKIFMGHFVKYNLQVDKKTQCFLTHKLYTYKYNTSEFKCVSPCQCLEWVAKLWLFLRSFLLCRNSMDHRCICGDCTLGTPILSAPFQEY